MYSWEELNKANSTIKTTDIKGKDYAEVNQRIKAFRMVCPHGQIITEMVSNENGICIFRASVYDEESKIIGTGTAYEQKDSTFINKTSYIENCETSAVGRALGMCGFGIDTSVASADEVANAINNQHKAPKQKDWRQEFIRICKEKGIDCTEYAQKHGINKKTTQDEYKDICSDLQDYTPQQDEPKKNAETVSMADL